MKVLIVTNLHPSPKRPHESPFVKEQVETMRACFPELTIDVRVIEGRRPKWEYVREIPLLPFVVKKNGYDIVHAHFGLTLISLLFVRVPIVVTFHGSDLLVKPSSYISRLLAPLAAKVIVVAGRLRETLGYGEVIPCGIPVKEFALPARLEGNPIKNKSRPLKVLFPANPARKVKNYGLFQAACRELEVRGYSIEEVLLAHVDRAKVRELYWDCDIMLLTSFSEGSPTVIKEAIAAKLPFVSVDVGDVREWAALVDFGVVVEGREAKTLSDAVTGLLERIGNRSSFDNSKCLEAMDNVNIAKRIKGVYDEILAVHELKKSD